MDEEPLAGGTVSTVVRVGDTVRRTWSRWSPGVHDLLRHLEAVGFEGAPRFLGVDEQGREILSWMDGTPASRPWPAELLTLDGLGGLARLLRGFHDAVGSYRPPDGAEWWIGQRPLEEGEIVIHGDLGPWNTIWRGGRPVGLIDWDFAEPAPRLTDVAELAFFVTPMRDDDHCVECGFSTPPDRRERLRVFCDAYGHHDVEEVVDAVERYWELEIQRTTTFGPRGIRPWDSFLARGLPEAEGELLAWVRDNRERFT